MSKPRQSKAEALFRQLSNKAWRMNNLYQVLTGEEGRMEIKPFRLRPDQERLYKERHNRNFIPKARKLGMSTAIVLDYLDECIWSHPDNPIHAAHVDFRDDDAKAKLDMAKLAWDKGPEHPNPAIAGIWKQLHERNPLVTRNEGELVWQNGSKQQASTSFMGGSPSRLHISEFGPMSVKFPLRAAAVKQGTFNALVASGIIDVETTMEGGMMGECSAIFQLAMSTMDKTQFNPLDWKMFFVPWYVHPDYDLPGEVPHNPDIIEYFAKLEISDGVKLPLSRQAWYEAKKAEQKSSMFTQFPTVVRECLFAGSNASYFDADALQWMRNQIIPFETQIEYGDIVIQGDIKDHNGRSASFVVKKPEVSPFQIIERPMEGRRYLIYADSCVGKQAEGSDDAKRDTHSYGVIRDEYVDPVSRERFLPQIVAMCRDDDKCITPEMIRRVVALSIYYGDCIVIPETNNKDDIATRMIAAGVKNMYVQGLIGADEAMPGTKKTTQVFGWLTTEGTRRQMLDNMREMTLQQRWICTFGAVLQQMSVFIINKKGRAEAAPSEHDDHVTGPAVGLFNLPHATKYVGREERIVRTYQQDWQEIYADPTGI